MIKVTKTHCKFCGRTIHGVTYRGDEIQCECSVCHEVFFVTPMEVNLESTKKSCETCKYEEIACDDQRCLLEFMVGNEYAYKYWKSKDKTKATEVSKNVIDRQ